MRLTSASRVDRLPFTERGGDLTGPAGRSGQLGEADQGAVRHRGGRAGVVGVGAAAALVDRVAARGQLDVVVLALRRPSTPEGVSAGQRRSADAFSTVTRLPGDAPISVQAHRRARCTR